MNPRFKYGGDKYESIREDDRRAFYDRVQAEQEHIIDVLKSVVSTWTENEILAGNEPIFERFIHEISEWDHDELYATISEEMERVTTILSRPCQAVQGA